MEGTVWRELAVPVAPEKMWAIFGTPRLFPLLTRLLPSVYRKVDVVQGDGGEGTVLCIHYITEESPETLTCKVRFAKLDPVTRVIEGETVEGGYLDVGFRKFRTRVEFNAGESAADPCVVRSTVHFEIGEGSEKNIRHLATEMLGVVALEEAVASFVLREEADAA